GGGLSAAALAAVVGRDAIVGGIDGLVGQVDAEEGRRVEAAVGEDRVALDGVAAVLCLRSAVQSRVAENGDAGGAVELEDVAGDAAALDPEVNIAVGTAGSGAGAVRAGAGAHRTGAGCPHADEVTRDDVGGGGGGWRADDVDAAQAVARNHIPGRRGDAAD